jgi:WD40 repeat protein
MQGPASSGLRRGYVLSTSPLNPALRVFEDDASQRSDEAEAAVAARVSAAVSGVGGYEEALDAQGMGTGVRVVRTAAKPEPRPNAPSLGAPVRVAVDWLAAGADGARFPFSHELLLAGHGGRPALAVAAEPSGARLCSGGGDREVHLYDLAGLDAASRQPFARVVPEDGHAVVALAYGGALLAVACDSPTPHLLDRASGERKAALARGDMYLRDARRTGGHTLGVRALAWNPAPEAAGDLATAGADGTLRLWDVSRPQKSLEVAVLPALGARAHVSACAYSPNGALVAAGCDRVAAVYPGRRGAAMNLARPRYLPPPLPHPVAALAFSPREPYLLAARDVAGVLHMFDLRSIDRGPLASCDGFPSRAGDVAGALLWSPDGDFVAAPHAFSDPAGSGAVVGALSVLAAPSLEPVRRVAVAAAEATCAAWCAATRQLVVGAADGSVRVLYDPVRSERGALLVRSRAPKRASAGAVSASVLVDTPLVRRSQRPPDATAVREAAAASGAARKLAKSSAPAKPLEGRGHGGALGQSHRGSLLHGLAAENAGDAREAFLAAAERAAADPVFTRGTAPSVLDYGVDDDDAVEDGPVDGSLGERSDDYVPTAMDELARKRFKGD